MKFKILLAALLGFLLTVLIAPPVFADYDDEEPEETNSTYVDTNAEATANAKAKAKANARATSRSSSNAEGGDASAGAFGVGIVKTDTAVTIEGDVYEGDDVKGAAKEIRKGMERSSPRAADPAHAGSFECDTAGATAQAGAGGGGFSAPTFPCEVLRTNQVKASLSAGFFDQWVLRPLLNVRLVFKGIWSVLPVIGN